jgi:hypothetical protein
LTSALDGGELSASRPGRFTPRERAAGSHWIGGWADPRAGLDTVVKRKIPSPRRESNPRTPIVQPVAQRHTEYFCFNIWKAEGEISDLIEQRQNFNINVNKNLVSCIFVSSYIGMISFHFQYYILLRGMLKYLDFTRLFLQRLFHL